MRKEIFALPLLALLAGCHKAPTDPWYVAGTAGGSATPSLPVSAKMQKKAIGLLETRVALGVDAAATTAFTDGAFTTDTACSSWLVRALAAPGETPTITFDGKNVISNVSGACSHLERAPVLVCLRGAPQGALTAGCE